MVDCELVWLFRIPFTSIALIVCTRTWQQVSLHLTELKALLLNYMLEKRLSVACFENNCLSKNQPTNKQTSCTMYAKCMFCVVFSCRMFFLASTLLWVAMTCGESVRLASTNNGLQSTSSTELLIVQSPTLGIHVHVHDQYLPTVGTWYTTIHV